MRKWVGEATLRPDIIYGGAAFKFKVRTAEREDGETCEFGVTSVDEGKVDEILDSFIDPRCTCWKPESNPAPCPIPEHRT